MKNILVTFLMIILFLGCGRPDTLSFYDQDANNSRYAQAWQELLLLPEEYLPQARTEHFKHPYFMSTYLTSNPGFININQFKEDFPDHELAKLKLWYSASFFRQKSIVHYVIMEFPTQEEAKTYVDRLKPPTDRKYYKILRYNSILFSFTLRNFYNEFKDTGSDLSSQLWIDQTIQRIRKHL